MDPINWLKRRIKEAGADSESATERDGSFSQAAEYHAFGIGLARGARDPYNWVSPLPEGDEEHYVDARAEPGYYYFGSFVGTLLQLILIGLAAAGILTGAGIEITFPFA